MPANHQEFPKLELILTDAYRIIVKYNYTGLVQNIKKHQKESGNSQFGEYVRQQYKNPEVKLWFKKTLKTLKQYKMNEDIFYSRIGDIDPAVSTATYLRYFLNAVNEVEQILTNPSLRSIYLLNNEYRSRVQYKNRTVFYSVNHTFQAGKTALMFEYLWPHREVIEVDGKVSRPGKPLSRKLVEKDTKLATDAQLSARNAANVVLSRAGIPVRIRSRRMDHKWLITVDYRNL